MKPVIKDRISVNRSISRFKQKVLKSCRKQNLISADSSEKPKTKSSRVIKASKLTSASPVERLHSQKTHKPARISVCEPADKERRIWAENRTSRTPGAGSDERTKPVFALRFGAGFMSFHHQPICSVFSSLLKPHGQARSRCTLAEPSAAAARTSDLAQRYTA